MNDYLNELAQKTEELKQKFKEQPETIITGVVLHSPVKQMLQPNIWRLALRLKPWKEPEGQINNSQIRISKDLSDEAEGEVELNDIKTKVLVKSAVRFRVKLLKGSSYGDERAELITILDPPTGSELQSLLDQSRETQIINHPVFGELKYNDLTNKFEGAIDWMGSSVIIKIDHDEKGSSDSSLETLQTLYDDSDNWSKKITDYAVSTLLELKNDTWLEEGQSEITVSQFTAAMKLKTIIARPDGKFDFWHNDGNLFRGHSIHVSGSLSEGPNFSDIPG